MNCSSPSANSKALKTRDTLFSYLWSWILWSCTKFVNTILICYLMLSISLYFCSCYYLISSFKALISLFYARFAASKHSILYFTRSSKTNSHSCSDAMYLWGLKSLKPFWVSLFFFKGFLVLSKFLNMLEFDLASSLSLDPSVCYLDKLLDLKMFIN